MPRHVLAGRLVVLLAQHLRIGGVARVIEPAGNRQAAIGCRERAECDHRALAGAEDHCVRLISCGEPGVDCGAMLFETISKMPALCRSLIERRIEVGLQRGSLRIGADRLEIRRGNADAVVAEVGARVDPVLRMHGKGSESCKSEQDGKTKTQRKFHENAKPSWVIFRANWGTLRVSISSDSR